MKKETSRKRKGRNGSTIEITHGSEGPRHDPYAYTEIKVTRADGRWAKIHGGLGEWLVVGLPVSNALGVEERCINGNPEYLRSMFELAVGITPELAEKTVHRMDANRIYHHKCGQKYLEWVSGYPGETFLQCGKCGDILESTFNRSAIE
jgi:hypothetical protein